MTTKTTKTKAGIKRAKKKPRKVPVRTTTRDKDPLAKAVEKLDKRTQAKAKLKKGIRRRIVIDSNSSPRSPQERLKNTKATAKAIKRARTNPVYFFLLMKEVINDTPEKPYYLGRLQRFLLNLVKDVTDGTSESLYNAVSVPPQHSKSTILTMIAGAWLLGRFPGIQLGITAYSHTLVCAFSMKIKDILDNPIYQEIFPGVKISKKLNKREEWLCTNGSKVIARARGIKFTGHKLDYLIIDDPHSGRHDAEQENRRRIIKDWFFADCMSRISPGGKVFIIMTRWHPQDLVGVLGDKDYIKDLELAGEGDKQFKFWNFPALATGGPDVFNRKEGEAVFPEYKDEKFLKGVKAIMPLYEWDSQFQGDPKPAGGGQVDITKIKRITFDQVPTNIQWARGWDTALTEHQTSDYSCGALCAWDPDSKEFYLIDMFRKKLVWTKLKNRVIAMALEDAEKYNAHIMGLEAVAGFDIGLRELRTSLQGQVKVRKCNPGRGGKLMRAQPWLNIAEGGSFHIVEGPWNKEFLDELMYFPDVDHDDQIDGVSVAWETLTKRAKGVIA